MKLGSGVLIAIGLAFLCIGIVGIVVPILPSTPFLLVASACFFKASPRLHAWLTSHPRLGPPIARVSSGKGLTRREKIMIYAFACAMILPVLILSTSTHLRVFLLALLIVKAVVFVRMKESCPTDGARPSDSTHPVE